MADLKMLSDEMTKLKKQIKTMLYISDYQNCDDLSGIDDFGQINTADQRQQVEEYRNIFRRLDEVQSILAYYERPVREVSRIYINKSGRYETDKGHYYTSGSSIEFLRAEEVYNYDADTWKNVEIWTTSRIESQDGRYYIVGYPGVELSGLTVRVRG